MLYFAFDLFVCSIYTFILLVVILIVFNSLELFCPFVFIIFAYIIFSSIFIPKMIIPISNLRFDITSLILIL